MDGLGEETRMRITFATLGGIFGTLAFIAIAMQSWITACFLVPGTGMLMWAATRRS